MLSRTSANARSALALRSIVATICKGCDPRIQRVSCNLTKSNFYVVDGIHGCGKTTLIEKIIRAVILHNEEHPESYIHIELVAENTDEIRKLAMEGHECYSLYAITEMLAKRFDNLAPLNSEGYTIYRIFDRGVLPSTVYTALLEHIDSVRSGRISSATAEETLRRAKARVSYFVDECIKRGFVPAQSNNIYITSPTGKFAQFESWVKQRARSNDIELTSEQYEMLGSLYDHFNELMRTIL